MWLWNFNCNCITNKNIPIIILSRKVTQKSQIQINSNVIGILLQLSVGKEPHPSPEVKQVSLGLHSWLEKTSQLISLCPQRVYGQLMRVQMGTACVLCSWNAGSDLPALPVTLWASLVRCTCCSVAWLCPTLLNPMDGITLGFPVLHCLSGVAQTHVYWVKDAIKSSHPLSSPSPSALSLSQHQGVFQWIGSSYQVVKVLECQPKHQLFQWIFRVDFL